MPLNPFEQAIAWQNQAQNQEYYRRRSWCSPKFYPATAQKTDAEVPTPKAPRLARRRAFLATKPTTRGESYEH